MKLFLILAFLVFLNLSAYAEDIAKCGPVEGYAYYINAGKADPKSSGWTPDKISKGMTQLIRDKNGEYDIMFVDVTKNIISSKADGAKIILINKFDKDVTFLVSYGAVIEIYSFFGENDGQYKYSNYSIKPNGGPVVIPKRSLMVGDCDFINFDKIK